MWALVLVDKSTGYINVHAYETREYAVGYAKILLRGYDVDIAELSATETVVEGYGFAIVSMTIPISMRAPVVVPAPVALSIPSPAKAKKAYGQ